MTRDPADEPIELHLPDGGQVIVTISDRIARDGDRAVELVVAMVSADGSEPGVAATIREEAEDLGLDYTTNGRHPTVIRIGPSATETH
jgi:molybdopterin biosynthesis enzyme MoaB